MDKEAGACPGQEFDQKTVSPFVSADFLLLVYLHGTWYQPVPGSSSRIRGSRPPLRHSSSRELQTGSTPRTKFRPASRERAL